MKRSLAILAVTAVCGGGTVAVATAAYASDGDDTRAEDSGGPLAGWLDGGSDAVDSDDPESTLTCLLPKDRSARPDLEGLLALPKLSDLPELLYSEQAVKDRDSDKVTYQVTQSGKVTDSSGETLTVESSDGTTWEWELTDDTTVYSKGRESKASSVQTGDQVLVHGTRDGDTRRADHIASPAPEIGLGTHPAPPQRLRDALPDNLRELPGLKECDESQPKEGTGTGTAA